MDIKILCSECKKIKTIKESELKHGDILDADYICSICKIENKSDIKTIEDIDKMWEEIEAEKRRFFEYVIKEEKKKWYKKWRKNIN